MVKKPMVRRNPRGVSTVDLLASLMSSLQEMDNNQA